MSTCEHCSHNRGVALAGGAQLVPGCCSYTEGLLVRFWAGRVVSGVQEADDPR